VDALHTGVEIEDPSDHALVDYVRKVVRQWGLMSEADIKTFLAAGFSRQQLLEVVLIVSTKILSNYINHITILEPNRYLLAML